MHKIFNAVIMKNTAMTSESYCSQAKDKQLYMLELLVDRLNLYPEKIQEIGSTPLIVRLEFLDFPVFEINEEEFWSTKKRKDKRTTLSSERKSGNGRLDLGAGKSCLFPKRPNELVDAMRSNSLKIGVYKTTVKKPCSPEEKETPICNSEVPLSGCLCDQVSMSMNDPSNLPKPYTLHNTWNLIDNEGNPSGTIFLFLRLTCLGKSIVTQFAIKDESFLFKSANSSDEFQCSRVPSENEDGMKKLAFENHDRICQPDGYREPEVNTSPKPQRIIGLGAICQELAKRDGAPVNIVPPLRLKTNRLIDEILTPKVDVPSETSEKDAECVCRPGGTFLKRMTREYPCGRGPCSGGLCAGSRNEKSFTGIDHAGTSMNLCYTGSCCSGKESSYRYRPRMRGGGRWNESSCVMGLGSDNHRLNNAENKNPRIPVRSMENLVSGACKSAISGSSSKKPGCGCFGKLGTGAMGLKLASARNDFSCSNEPCHGVDCLIRAFKETEDFVESIGKVPGLAGLGLMDPTESPYFGRERDDAPTSCDTKISSFSTKIPSSFNYPRSQATGRFDGKTINTIMPVQNIVSGPYRDHKIHQFDAISQSGKTKKKIEEKLEKIKESQESHYHQNHHQATVESEPSPCGEPVCKSRKKKLSEEAANEESSITKLQETTKIAAANKTWNSRKRQRGKSFGLLGGAGDRASNHRNSHIRVSKKIKRLVNAMRDRRFCHGHKNCLDVRLRVPGNMGWLWNTRESPGRLKTPIGWKPGAISKFVWERMQQAKSVSAETGSSSEIRPVTASSKGKRNRAMRSKSFHSLGRSQWAKNRMHDNDDDEIELPPTLHIHRKDGTYYVTMYPVKGQSANNEEIEEHPKPLQFKITKNKDDDMMSASSTGSDMEIEFSPPAAINRYRKKEPVRDENTQVSQQEILDTFKVTSVKRQSKTKKVKAKK